MLKPVVGSRLMSVVKAMSAVRIKLPYTGAFVPSGSPRISSAHSGHSAMTRGEALLHTPPQAQYCCGEYEGKAKEKKKQENGSKMGSALDYVIK